MCAMQYVLPVQHCQYCIYSRCSLQLGITESLRLVWFIKPFPWCKHSGDLKKQTVGDERCKWTLMWCVACVMFVTVSWIANVSTWTKAVPEMTYILCWWDVKHYSLTGSVLELTIELRNFNWHICVPAVYISVFQLFCCSGTLHKCHRHSRNPMQWSSRV